MASFLLPRPQLISWGGDRKAAGYSISSGISFSPARKAAAGLSYNQIFRGPPKVVSSSSPWLMLPPSLDGSDLVYDFYCLAEDKVVSFNKRAGNESKLMPDDKATFVGMSHGWLICYNCDHRGKGDASLFLSNPISGRHIKLPNLPYTAGDLENVIISSPDPDDHNCRALMIYGPARRLAFCCPARSSNWTPFGNTRRRYCSSVYSTSQKLFFCATEKEDVIGIGIEAWDLNRLGSPVMIPTTDEWVNDFGYPVSCSSERDRNAKFLYQPSTSLALADKSNDLYLVRRFTVLRMGPDGSHVKIMKFGELAVKEVFPYQTTDFDVYKYDKDFQGWKYMDYLLDGMALFVGKNHGFVLSAADYPEVKPDAIYFTDVEKNPFYQAMGGGHDMGIFDYRSKTISPCYYEPFDYRMVLPPPLWFTPSCNWYNPIL